jgi:signal transduction histidine kinase
VGSLATVPLLFKGRVIGSLNLGRGRPQPFTGFDLATLEPLARHIASALANARLLDDVRRRGQERESLLDVGRSISERLDLVEVLPLITRSVNRVMGTQHCLLLLRFGDRLHVAAQEGFEPDVLEMIGSLRVGESLSGWVAREGQALALEDFRADPRAGFLETAERYGYRSLLCVPLKRADEVLGTLEVVTKERRCFGPEDQALMMSFAAQASVAIENARLFEEAHQRLTELTEANRRLEELHRLRQQYLRNVSHEFRTPLTVIKGYAEFLQESPPAADALREVLGIVLESSDRLIDMVDTLIDVSRIEQEEEPEKLLQVQSLDLAELARGSVESFRWAAARKNIAFDLKFPEGTLVLHGDQGLLLQAVRKLLDNALKYSPSNSRVVLRGGEEDGGLWLEVEDSGIGIATEHQGRIFEKFYTVDGSLTRRVGGTGVGLYLVREIVRLHQGSVSVRSRLGQGSVFSVRLPRKLQGTWRPAPVFATRTIT